MEHRDSALARLDSLDEIEFHDVVRALRPDLSDEQIALGWLEMQEALKHSVLN